MQTHELIESPLNYTGGKFRLLSQIFPLFPARCREFVDLFCGGCNVGINARAERVWFNDKNEALLNIYKVFRQYGADMTLAKIRDCIKKYGLSDAATHGYEYYGCASSDGLGAYNKTHYLQLREDVNSKTRRSSAYYIMLYVLIIYSFNNQIRFNSKGKFNLPVGKRDLNTRMAGKIQRFIKCLCSTDCRFTSLDFRKVRSDWTHDDFVYADPPYLITNAAYNENNGWTREDEAALLDYLDELDGLNVPFALSNVMSSKGTENDLLIRWCERGRYTVHHLNKTYANANYHRKNKELSTDEVLITNY